MDNQARHGQVLPFARSADYLRRLAIRQRDANNPLKALDLLRLCLQKTPGDPRTVLEIAITYGQMRCPNLANRYLFSLLSDDELAPECLFYAGCNFYLLQMIDAARDCLMHALQKRPDAQFAQHAVEVIGDIDDRLHGASEPEARINRRVGRALDALDRGSPALSARLIRRALALEKRNGSAHALLSFAQLTAGDKDGALSSARFAWRCARHDVRSLCAMAAALHGSGSAKAAETFLKRAMDKIESEDDAHLICRTACRMRAHAIVRSILLPIEAETPYADEVLHLLAIASHNLGDAEEAVRRWRLIRRIDPADAVAAYFLGLSEAGGLPPALPYARGVPLSETLRRLNTLRGWVQEGPAAFRARWEEDEALEQMLRWGLCADEPGIPQAMLGILATLGDARARAALRDTLPDCVQSDATKHGALAALFVAGAEGPFHAIIDGRLALVHVTRAEQKDARQNAMARLLANRVRPQNPDEERRLDALCALAAKQPDLCGASMRARAVELAFRRARGEKVTTDADRGRRRKLDRFAKRLQGRMDREMRQF